MHIVMWTCLPRTRMAVCGLWSVYDWFWSRIWTGMHAYISTS